MYSLQEKIYIAYDFKRLVKNLRRPFPSDIERVDINYLKRFIRNINFHIIAVIDIKINNKFTIFKISDELKNKIFTHLSNRWMNGIIDDKEFEARGKALLTELIDALKSKTHA